MTPRVYMRHLRALDYCARGVRAFFKRHGFDYPDFLRNGIEVEKFYGTGDSMAIKAAQMAEAES